MKDVKESYGLGRLVVVTDKGLNSSKNIDVISKHKLSVAPNLLDQKFNVKNPNTVWVKTSLAV